MVRGGVEPPTFRFSGRQTTSPGPIRSILHRRRPPHRATYVPHARVFNGQPRSLTSSFPPMASTAVRARYPPGRATDLPSW